MNRSLFPVLALLFGLPILLCGQTASPASRRDVPIPQPPFVEALQPGTQWSITVKSPAISASLSQKHAVQIKYQHTAEVTFVSAEWSDGTKNEGYVKGDKVIFADPKHETCYTIPAQDDDLSSPVFVFGYLGTDWINQADYQGSELIDGEPCFRFFKDAQGLNTESPIPAHSAWIRARDKVPVRVKIGDTLFLYSPITAALSPLIIPPKVRAYMEVVEVQQSALNLLRQLNQRQ